MERSCSRGAKEESRCCQRILTRCRAEDLFENLRHVPRENRRRGRPSRDRAQYSPGETLRSKASNGTGRISLLEDHNRQKADADIWQTTFRDRSLESGELRSHALKAINVPVAYEVLRRRAC